MAPRRDRLAADKCCCAIVGIPGQYCIISICSGIRLDIGGVSIAQPLQAWPTPAIALGLSLALAYFWLSTLVLAFSGIENTGAPYAGDLQIEDVTNHVVNRFFLFDAHRNSLDCQVFTEAQPQQLEFADGTITSQRFDVCTMEGASIDASTPLELTALAQLGGPASSPADPLELRQISRTIVVQLSYKCNRFAYGLKVRNFFRDTRLININITMCYGAYSGIGAATDCLLFRFYSRFFLASVGEGLRRNRLPPRTNGNSGRGCFHAASATAPRFQTRSGLSCGGMSGGERGI